MHLKQYMKRKILWHLNIKMEIQLPNNIDENICHESSAIRDKKLLTRIHQVQHKNSKLLQNTFKVTHHLSSLYQKFLLDNTLT